MLPSALYLFALVEILATLLLVSVTNNSRIAADQRLAVEAELALESSLALLRVGQAETINRLTQGQQVVLSGALPGWILAAAAMRDSTGPIIELTVRVVRDTVNEGPRITREGTLLLRLGPADTAYVIGSRSRF